MCIRRWRENKVQVLISTADVTNAKGALQLIKEAKTLGSVGGIFNLAVVSNKQVRRELFIEYIVIYLYLS